MAKVVGVLFEIPSGASFLCCIGRSLLLQGGLCTLPSFFDQRIMHNIESETYLVHHVHYQALNDMATHPTSLHGIRIRSGRLNESDSI